MFNAHTYRLHRLPEYKFEKTKCENFHLVHYSFLFLLRHAELENYTVYASIIHTLYIDVNSHGSSVSLQKSTFLLRSHEQH